MEPLISIIIPVYNVEFYLGVCLDSIIAQDYTNWECILVDDGSKDRSGEICDEYSQRDSRFHVIHGENHGVSHARNVGLDLAKGEWICFVDSDDSIVNNALSHMLQVIRVYNGDVCICPIIRDRVSTIKTAILNPAGKEQLVWACLAYRTDKYVVDGLMVDAPHAKLFNAAIINDNKLRFVEGLSKSEDAIFDAQFYHYCSRILIDSYPVYKYTINPNSLCHTYKIDNISMFETLIEEEKKIIKNCHLESARFKDILNIRVFVALEQVLYETHVDALPISFRIKAIRQFMSLEQIRSIIKSTSYSQISPYLTGRSKKVDLFLTQKGLYYALCFWIDLRKFMLKTRGFVSKMIKQILRIDGNTKLMAIIRKRSK